MKFTISRVSAKSKKKPPCKIAKLSYRGREKCWIVELDSLEDLIKLIDDVGDSLIVSHGYSEFGGDIVIYDDYFE